MAQIFIDFTWYRDPAGYELLPYVPPQSIPARPAEGGTLLEIAPNIILAPRRPQRIVRRGGRLVSYRPLERCEALSRTFAGSATTPEGAFRFVEDFGPLTKRGLEKKCGEDVQDIVAHAIQMSRLLDAYERGDRTEIVRTLGPKGKELGDSNLGVIKTSLAFDPGDSTPKLRFTVENLLTALWLHLGQTLSDGAHLRKCLHCHKVFDVGPGTGRRADAKFCSDDHRVAFNSRKRTKEGLDA